jgi:hypothetical protein
VTKLFLLKIRGEDSLFRFDKIHGLGDCPFQFVLLRLFSSFDDGFLVFLLLLVISICAGVALLVLRIILISVVVVQ